MITGKVLIYRLSQTCNLYIPFDYTRFSPSTCFLTCKQLSCLCPAAVRPTLQLSIFVKQYTTAMVNTAITREENCGRGIIQCQYFTVCLASLPDAIDLRNCMIPSPPSIYKWFLCGNCVSRCRLLELYHLWRAEVFVLFLCEDDLVVRSSRLNNAPSPCCSNVET